MTSPAFSDGQLLEGLAAACDAASLPGQPPPLFAAVETALARLIGARMLTIMQFLPTTVELVRLHSNLAQAYPPGGRKSKRGLPWTDHVLVQRKTFVGRTASDLRWAFDDADVLIGLGLGCVINQPVVWNGHVLGTLNLLDTEGRLGERRHVDAVRLFAGLLRPVLIAMKAN